MEGGEARRPVGQAGSSSAQPVAQGESGAQPLGQPVALAAQAAQSLGQPVGQAGSSSAQPVAQGEGGAQPVGQPVAQAEETAQSLGQPVALAAQAAHSLAQALAALCGEHQAFDVRRYVLEEEARIADEVVIATVGSERVLHFLSEEVRDYLKREARLPQSGVPRHDRSGWVVIDCGEVIVHLMTRERREYYNLDKLYE